jgi:methionyl-tRNA synthetase|tara:strand:+ start:4799 stop:6310 length:1512 start_codon:yes stop_codon:yes gene_type:complete
MKSYYLTTPIYYASGEPHIGHAYTTILTDTLARYRRLTGSQVEFLTGTDEHGQKMKEAAAQKSMPPQELADAMAKGFKGAWADLDISFDRFIRTTEDAHVDFVQDILSQLWEKGEIYADNYSGWYCIHEERYWTSREVGEEHICPDCRRPVEYIEEKNYFFRMGYYQDKLLKHINDNPKWIVPETRLNEVLGFLNQPLGDLSISRPKTRLDWGITVPFDESHVCYVWVDALFSYVTGANFPNTQSNPQKHCNWPADLQVVGKDILTTHAVYWPTLLMASGLPLPKKILAHGWWLSDNTKMSKSMGNVIDPLQLRKKYGTDAVRWYLLRDMRTGLDATFTHKRFATRYEELANVLGNLVSRTTSMIAKYRSGQLPGKIETELGEEIDKTMDNFQKYMDELQVHSALEIAMDLARQANVYIDKQEPWTLAKDPEQADHLDTVLATLVKILTVLTTLFSPVMPEKMNTLAKRIGLSKLPTFKDLDLVFSTRSSVEVGKPLFPKDNL